MQDHLTHQEYGGSKNEKDTISFSDSVLSESHQYSMHRNDGVYGDY